MSGNNGLENGNFEKDIDGLELNTANEIFNDMYFIVKLFRIQECIDDIWLRDYYSKIIISYLSIVLHECIQAELLDKEKSDTKAVEILKSIRQRTVKLIPDGNSGTINHIMSEMGIDFDHYCFDLQITLNEAKKQELFDIGFTYYDLLDNTGDFETLNSLINIPLQIVEGMISRFFSWDLEQYKKAFDISNQNMYLSQGQIISKEISLHKYPYASGILFKYPEPCREDKITILYYFTLVKQAIVLNVLVPDIINEDGINIDTLSAKCKFRAIIIENIGQYLKKADTPLAKELQATVRMAVRETFFSKNRAVKNNIHYKKIAHYKKEELLDLFNQQEKYLETVMAIFKSKIKYSVGWKYKLIRCIADRTDETMIEVRKKNKSIKKVEDVSVVEWKEAQERLKKKN